MDKPAYERFFKMLKDYLTFDFGKFLENQKVTTLVIDKYRIHFTWFMDNTFSLFSFNTAWNKKGYKDGSKFDIVSSSIVTIGYAIPNFLFAVILIVFFAGGRFYDIFKRFIFKILMN